MGYIYNYTLDISGIHVPVSKKLGHRQKEELFLKSGSGKRERERESKQWGSVASLLSKPFHHSTPMPAAASSSVAPSRERSRKLPAPQRSPKRVRIRLTKLRPSVILVGPLLHVTCLQGEREKEREKKWPWLTSWRSIAQLKTREVS